MSKVTKKKTALAFSNETYTCTASDLVEELYKVKDKKKEITKRYNELNDELKGMMKVGETVNGYTVSVTLEQNERLMVQVEALKNAYPEAYQDCLQVELAVAERKFGRDNLELIGTKIPWQRKFKFAPKER